MRVNIYGEELTSKVELIRKAVDQRTFHGIRLYLKSSPALYHSDSDNDESAITLWAPWTKEKESDLAFLKSILGIMACDVQLEIENIKRMKE